MLHGYGGRGFVQCQEGNDTIDGGDLEDIVKVDGSFQDYKRFHFQMEWLRLLSQEIINT